jgi:hypothetical protein
MKSGLVLFHEAMEKFDPYDLNWSFLRFERAAAKGHEESIWIGSVVKDLDMEDRDAVTEAFVKMEEPLGWYFAGMLSELDSREEFDFYKKSAEGGCSWGQVGYGLFFRDGVFVELDDTVYFEWVQKAANQNNPSGLDFAGSWYRYEIGDMDKAMAYYLAAAEQGSKSAMESLAYMWGDEEDSCAKDWRQAVIWSVRGDVWELFGKLQSFTRRSLENGTTQNLNCNFHQLCYALGWGYYWGMEGYDLGDEEEQAFGNRCLEYYCSCVELQQKSIFTFLLCWNQTVGVKDVGVMIGKMVWEGREDNLVKEF